MSMDSGDDEAPGGQTSENCKLIMKELSKHFGLENITPEQEIMLFKALKELGVLYKPDPDTSSQS
jgi:hypothetical protein